MTQQRPGGVTFCAAAAVLLSLFASELVFANSVIRGRNQFDYNDPYEIVYESEKVDTKAKPGIYAIVRGKEDGELIIAGKVMDANRNFSGIIGGFHMTNVTRRSESFAIVDGRLVLFANLTSKPNLNPKTERAALIFGKNVTIRDALTGLPVTLQPITSTKEDQISILVDNSNGTESYMFLVSLNQPMAHGTGLTFVGSLKRTTGGLELNGDPVVIDYTFQSTSELERLRVGGNTVLSRLHLLQVAQPQGNDDRILKRYRENARRMASELLPGAAAKSKRVTEEVDPATGQRLFKSPHYNVLKRELVSDHVPVELIPGSAIPILQRVDPFRGQSGLFFGSPTSEYNNPNRPPAILGRVDYDATTHKYKVVDLRSAGGDSKRQVGLPEGSDVTLVSVDGIVHALYKNPGSTSVEIVSLANAISKNLLSQKELSGFKISLPVNAGTGIMHYLFVSMPGNTFVIKIMQAAEYTKVIDTLTVLNSFATVKEIYSRIKIQPSSPNPTLLFDTVSEKIKSSPPSADGHRAVNEQDYVAYTDLTESARNSAKQVYLNAIQTVTLMAPSVVWRQYNPKGAVIQKTGIYLDPLEELKRAAVNIDPATYTRFLPGVILTDDDRPQNISGAPKIRRKKAQSEFADKKNSIRIHQDINIEKSGIPELKMTFIPFMSPSAAGKVGFNLAIFADEEPKALGRKILPLLQEVYIPVDFSRFLGLKVVQGRRKHSDEFALMIFVSEKDQASINASPLRGGSGVYVLNFRVNQHAAGPLIQLSLLNSDNNDGLWLALSQVSGEQIKNRVTYDADGHPLWIETPELDKTNKNYQIRYLNRNNDRSMYVNQGLSQVRVRWDEGLEDSWDLQYSRKSRWMVGYRSNLEQRINGLEKYLEEQKTLEETRAKKGKKAVNKRNEALFPDLNDYLEHLAAQDSPREHTVLLVEPGMLTNLRMLITSRLLEKPEQKHAWNLDNSKFGFYVYDPSFPMDETMNNLSMIGRGSNRDVLFVDLEVVKDLEAQDSPRSYNDADGDGSESQNQILPKLMRADTQDVDKNTSANASGDQQQNERKRSPDGAGNDESNERALRFAYARLAYLATEGDVVNLRRFEHSQPTNRIPTLILATPAMWREYKSRFPQEEKAGVFNHFKVDARFLTGPWTVWSPKSAQASAETLQYQQSAASKDEYMIFKNLDHILQAAASSKEPAKHQLLVVPEEIKPLITRLIMTRWATDMPELDGPWSFRNRELALFQLGAAGTQQDQIFDNYESMRGSLASRRPVLLADMSEILKAGRVSAANIDASFRVRDPLISAQPASSLLTEIDSQSKSKKVEADALQSNGEVDDNDADGEESAMRSQLPHMIWWLATEGKKIQPKKAKGWSLRAEVKPEIPTLILTTEKELETLAQDASFEARFMKIEDTFAVTRMERPSDQDKASFLEDLFRRPNIASLNYEFRHNDLPSDQARKQLIGLLIGQVEQIARQLKLEPTYAFLKIYIALNKALTEDVELRRSRYVDAPSLFRLFARVFPLPLTYEILRPEDPLQKLREADRASRGLEEAGYNGPMELKTRHVRNITSHTRAAGDSSRRIPSSQVLIGEPGTGKTFLLEVTARFLGLKLYDFNKPHEEDAGAMFLRVMDLVDEPDPAHPEKMDVKKAIEHMSNFLALPNGWRGMLVIDDLHKAGSAKILSQLMSFIQSLQEAPSGIYRARRMAVQGQTGEVKEIPVRNIMLNVTLNPTKDRDLRKRFLSEYGEKNPALEAVAALTRDGYTVEDSFFSRFTDIIDMSQFPREAKVPAILKNIREANATEYATRPRVVLVSPLTLNHLMDQFQAANARDLISPATFAMLNLTSNLRKAPLYLIDPQTKIGEAAAQDSTLADRKPVWNNWMSESKKVEPGQIEEALRSHTVVHAITQDDAVSKLQLLSFMADNFRGSLYFALILDAQNSPLLTHSYEARANNLFSFLAAVIGNVGQFRRLPLKEMNIKPQDLGVRDLDNITTLQTEIKKHASNASMPKIRIPVGVVLGAQVDLSSFLGNKERTFSERRRLDVMVETTAEVQTVVEKLLAKVYHVENLKDLTNPLNWINSLDETDPKAAFKEASGELFRIYLKFARSLYDMNLEEARNSEGLLQMQSYDEARLFLLCVDRALTQLPWSYLTQFTLSAAHLAASDLAIGQKIGLQHFLFKSNFSPLATVTPESILTNTRSISALKDLSTERENAYHTRFDTSCDRFLKTTAQ